MARHGEEGGARQVKDWQASQGMARVGRARRGLAGGERRGEDWPGTDWIGRLGEDGSVKEWIGRAGQVSAGQAGPVEEGEGNINNLTQKERSHS
jgi:hypothetical protein